MPRTTAPSTNPRIISGYSPYSKYSSTATRPKGSATSTEERRQLLLDDPHARDVHPEQVTCTRCSRIVRLQKGKAYHLAHWLDHRWRCEKAITADPQPRAKCHTLLERKELLEADPDAQRVEAGHVVCGMCDKKIKFRRGRPYGLSTWTQHKATCQLTNSASTSASVADSPSPPPSEQNTELKCDPLVAAIESQRVKCALCLSWIDISLQAEMDVYAWRRHRASCVAENFQDDKLGWTRARFFRPRHRLAVTTDQEAETDSRGSPVADDIPHRDPGSNSPADTVRDGPVHGLPPSSQASLTTKMGDARSNRVNPARITSAPHLSSPARSPSPPPLSFSEATSADTSAAPTPVTSPRRAHIFPDTRHLPFPEYTPLSLSRFVFDKPNTEREYSALGLRLSSSESPEETQSHRTTLPPYLERTQLSLPMPTRYWRFGSID